MTSGFGVAMARVDPVPQKAPLLTAGLSATKPGKVCLATAEVRF